MSNPQEFYQSHLQKHQKDYEVLNKTYNTISWSRAIVFFVGAGLSYLLFVTSFSLGMLMSVVALFGFLYLIKKHTEISSRRDQLKRVIALHEQELEALAFNFSTFDEGKDFIDPQHAYSYDLDIVGRASLFQYINRTGTETGRQRLVQDLHYPPLEVAAIRERQSAVQDMAKDPQWQIRFQATAQGMEESGKERISLQKWLEEPLFFRLNPWYGRLLWILPTIFFLALAAWLVPDLPPLREALGPYRAPGWVPGLIFFLNLGVIGRHLKRTARQQLQVGKQSRVLKAYGELLAQIETRSSEAELLTRQQKDLETKGEKASEAIRRLGELAGLLDQRLNFLVGLFFNGMLLWDIRYMHKLEGWKEEYADQLLPWIDLIGEWDVWQSFGRNCYNYPAHTFPEVHEGEFSLEAKELGHPLLKADTRVCNDMSLGKPGEFLVVTGANMAGKSTFLRTVGTNLILAHCGAVVCAESYRFAPISLITSIRAHDSLEDNESYFYAELKQLKKIIDRLQEGTAFVIVDEMLRGTNSRDKQTGSRKFIEQLIHLKGVGMIATHDLALGELATEYPDYARNKRFEVDIKEDHLHFDYKLQDGISQNLNATFLMEQMGIMPKS
ncbi:MAG: hypothetical protein AAFN10_21155 [Bacteroidota bacterium]